MFTAKNRESKEKPNTSQQSRGAHSKDTPDATCDHVTVSPNPLSASLAINRLEEPGSASGATMPATGPKTGTEAKGLIVDGSAALLLPQQMAKEAFLTAFREALLVELPAWLAGTVFTVEDCPYIDYWFNYYQGRPASHVERAAQLYLGGAASKVESAVDYIPLLVTRTQKAVTQWLATGQIGDMLPMMQQAGPAEAGEALLSRLAQKSGGDIAALPPRTVMNALGPGQPLPGGVENRLSANFGTSFGDVRVHQDSRAEKLAQAMDARAFTVGKHIVFGPGQFAPGNIQSDLVLAHELAHTLQQHVGSRQPDSSTRSDEAALERNADRLAIAAMARDEQHSRAYPFTQRHQEPLLDILDEIHQTSVIQESGLALRRCKSANRAENCPDKAPSPQKINTMADFIALVRRVEASTPTGNDPIATAQLISRTKYTGRAWDWMLPSTKGQPGVVEGGTVTADDIAGLCFKLIVSVPGGGKEDPMHVIVAIVADAEKLAAGTGASGLSRLAGSLPASVSQRGAVTWVGDVGKAASGWMAVLPLPKGARTKGGSTKDDYMLESAPPHDLMADVDGVAMTSKSAASGFAFDKTKPLSDNLERFFTPAAHTGRERRFHVFCTAEGLSFEADGFTLTAAAKATIAERVKDFAEWSGKNDPAVLKWVAVQGKSYVMSKAWVERAGDWQWFADKFINFVQQGLNAEGK